MKSLWSVLFSNALARDYAIAGLAVCILAVFGVQAISHLAEGWRRTTRVEQVTIAPESTTVARNYQVSRSVLDDAIVTGSISPRADKRPIILDPCTGQVKLQ